jgi:hypothetical protein
MNVPAYYLSADQNTTMTYANVQDERKQFYALSIEPYIQAIQTRLSMDDISTSGHEVRFAVFDTFLKNDPLVELCRYEKMLSLGLITVEQAMEMSDLTPNGSEGISNGNLYTSKHPQSSAAKNAEKSAAKSFQWEGRNR